MAVIRLWEDGQGVLGGVLAMLVDEGEVSGVYGTGKGGLYNGLRFLELGREGREGGFLLKCRVHCFGWVYCLHICGDYSCKKHLGYAVGIKGGKGGGGWQEVVIRVLLLLTLMLLMNCVSVNGQLVYQEAAQSSFHPVTRALVKALVQQHGFITMARLSQLSLGVSGDNAMANVVFREVLFF